MRPSLILLLGTLLSLGQPVSAHRIGPKRGERELQAQQRKTPPPHTMVMLGQNYGQPSQHSPEDVQVNVRYQPGVFSDGAKSDDNELRLSNGLQARPIAVKGTAVELHDGTSSTERFHVSPDGAAVIPKDDGGWYYVSNAEANVTGTEWNKGGVGSIEFDADGNVVGYQRIASRTRMNCSGGKTPWNSWITCEEYAGGTVWQTDPTGARQHESTSLGTLGWYESFAYDDGDPDGVRFYVTRDDDHAVLTRFTPDDEGMECYNQANPDDRWCTLNHGTIDYLLISGESSGTFTWTTNYDDAAANAFKYYPHSEGMDIVNGVLYFTSKVLKRLTILDLRSLKYTYESTVSGAFNQEPDQVARLVGDEAGDGILYFCEDAKEKNDAPGIFGRDKEGKYFTILYGRGKIVEETTGLAFSEDGIHMYVAFQKSGTIYDVWRDDGLPFDGAMLDIKYHSSSTQ